MTSNGAYFSGEKLSGENECFDLERGVAWVEIDLDYEPGSLLDSLNAWREKVVAVHSGGFLGFHAV